MRKYLQPRNYLYGLLRVSNEKLFRHIENVFAPRYSDDIVHPPVFIVGPPRSGSTLVMQVITDAFDFGYLSNRHCRYYGAPSLAEKLFRPLRNRTVSDYSSVYGDTVGPSAPSECGNWWYRFFRRHPVYVGASDISEKHLREFRRAVAALSKSFERPVLFKNLYASFRLQAIARALPESLFIVMRRNEIDNGHSLLEARYRSFGNYGQWFSLMPPDMVQFLDAPPYQQVIEQIRNIRNTVNRDLDAADVAPSRRFDIDYEAFCDEPRRVLEDLRSFLASNNCIVVARGEIPASFARRDSVRIDQDMFAEMCRYVASDIE